VVPRAAHRVPDEEPLGERPVIVGAVRPHGEQPLPAGEEDVFAVHLAEHHAVLGSLRQRQAGAEAALGTIVFFGHGGLSQA
jgi:hypothetical protein